MTDTTHELVSALKQLAFELGRVPNRDEFCRASAGRKYQVDAVGGFIQLVQMAGLKPHRIPKEPRIDNSIFERDIEKHLAEYQPKPYTPPGPYPTAAIISDIHWPFSCQRVIDAFYVYVEREQPEWVIINGDAWDMYSHSKYPRSHNVFTPREEERLASEANVTFWKEIKKRSPKSKLVQMMGNHDVRAMKRVLEVYPEAEDWIKEKLEKLFTFEGVKTIHDPREELFLNDDTLVFHGYRSGLGAHRDYTLMNCLNGHTHVGGVVWRQLRGKLIFEGNSGIAGDPSAKGLTYVPQKIIHWTPGFLGLTRIAPMFIPA
jgi:predicted phosphodiesterase